MASANETLVRRAIEAIWNRGDLDVADELFAPGFVNHNGLITDLVFGPEAIKIERGVLSPGVSRPACHRGGIDDKKTPVVLCWTAGRTIRRRP